MGHLWKRGKIWYMGYQDRRGKWIQKSTPTTDKQAAKGKLIEAERRVSVGDAKPLAEFLREYLKGRALEVDPRSLTRYQNICDDMTHQYSPLANLNMQDLTLAAIDAYVAWRLGHSRSKTTITRELSWLKQALDKAVRDKRLSFESAYLIKTENRPQLQKPAREGHVLLPHEFDRLYALASPLLRDVMVVALWTGLGRQNLLDLTEAHADFSTDPAVIRFSQAEMKGKRGGLIVRLPDRVQSVLWGRWTGNPERRFFEDFRWLWLRFQQKHAPSGFQFHDFRTSYISYRLGAGIDPKRVQAEVANKTSGMTMDCYGRALTDPAAIEWGQKHFRFPWDGVSYLQDDPSENRTEGVRGNAGSGLRE